MYTQFFTVDAALVWGAVPETTRSRITSSIWCRRCNTLVPMGNITGKMKEADLVLKGSCCFCFKSLTRVVKAEELTMKLS